MKIPVWRIEKVRPRIERHGKKLKLVRYEYMWIISCYGAFGGPATTYKEACRKLHSGQADMMLHD